MSKDLGKIAEPNSLQVQNLPVMMHLVASFDNYVPIEWAPVKWISGFSLFQFSNEQKNGRVRACHSPSMHLFRWQRLPPWPSLSMSAPAIFTLGGGSGWTDAERGSGNRFAVEPNLSKNEPRSHLIYAKKKHLEKLSEYPFSSQEWDQNSPPWMVTVAPVAEVGGRRSMCGA